MIQLFYSLTTVQWGFDLRFAEIYLATYAEILNMGLLYPLYNPNTIPYASHLQSSALFMYGKQSWCHRDVGNPGKLLCSEGPTSIDLETSWAKGKVSLGVRNSCKVSIIFPKHSHPRYHCGSGSSIKILRFIWEWQAKTVWMAEWEFPLGFEHRSSWLLDQLSNHQTTYWKGSINANYSNSIIVLPLAVPSRSITSINGSVF